MSDSASPTPREVQGIFVWSCDTAHSVCVHLDGYGDIEFDTDAADNAAELFRLRQNDPVTCKLLHTSQGPRIISVVLSGSDDDDEETAVRLSAREAFRRARAIFSAPPENAAREATRPLPSNSRPPRTALADVHSQEPTQRSVFTDPDTFRSAWATFQGSRSSNSMETRGRTVVNSDTDDVLDNRSSRDGQSNIGAISTASEPREAPRVRTLTSASRLFDSDDSDDDFLFGNFIHDSRLGATSQSPQRREEGARLFDSDDGDDLFGNPTIPPRDSSTTIPSGDQEVLAIVRNYRFSDSDSDSNSWDTDWSGSPREPPSDLISELRQRLQERRELRRATANNEASDLSHLGPSDSGTGFDVARFHDRVHDELMCTVCWGVLNNPVLTSCDHLFCRYCMSRWLAEKSSCPVDRQRLKLPQDVRTAPRFIKNMLDGLTLRCDFAERGCAAVLTLVDVESHQKRCPHRGQD